VRFDGGSLPQSTLMTNPWEPAPPSPPDDATRPYGPGEQAGGANPPGSGAPPPGRGGLPDGQAWDGWIRGAPQTDQPPAGPPAGLPPAGLPPAGLPPIGPPETVPGRNPYALVALVLVVAVLAAAGGWYLLLRPAGDAGSGPSASPSAITAVTSPTPVSRTPRPTPTLAAGGPTEAASPGATQEPAVSPATPSSSLAPAGSAAPSGPPGSTGPDASIDPAIVAQIDQVVGQVPAIRGLQPKQNVPYRFISQDQFSALFQQEFDKDNPPAQLAAEESFEKRIGLLPAAANLKSLVTQLYSSQVAAFYDPNTKQFTVIQRDSTFGPSDKIFVAHEYDHALQDQYWHLNETDIKDPSQGDAAAANLALVEGDATALMYQWAFANLTPAEIAQAVTDSGSPGDQQVLNSMPLLLREQLTFPYVDGLQFVSALQASGAGGWPEVNKAWDKRPSSTEQIMHPEKYLAGEAPVPVSLSDFAGRLGAGWKTNYIQTMGELETGIWLADGQGGGSAASGLPAPLPNADAAAGWGGDRLDSIDGPDGKWAIVWQTDWDTPDDADQFATAASSVMADLPGAHEAIKASIAGALGAPVLVVVASDQQVLNTVKLALPSG
jgi:hypothetical protein